MPSSDVDLHLPDSFVVGEWTVAPSRNLLIRGEEQVRVEPRVMDVLAHLAMGAGQLVSKEDLNARVWSGRYVTDDVLTVTIYTLRKALGDDARRPRYIETVSRRGYRLIVPVQSPAPPSARSAFDAPPSVVPPRSRAFPLPMALSFAALGAVAVGAVWMLVVLRHTPHVPPAESHEAYLKGRYFLDQRSVQGWQQALDQFQRAVAIDPQDPAAQAGLADTYSAMSDFGVASPAEMRPRAMKAARRALELDPSSAEGHEALGRAEFLFDWDFAAAERSLNRAVALDPDYMPAYQSMAWLQSALGQQTAAIAAARRALQLDPVNTARYTELAWVLVLGGQYDAALREVDRALLLNPRAYEIYIVRGWTSEVAGRPDAAIAAYRDAWRVSGAPDAVLQGVDAAYREDGLRGYYRNWLNRPVTSSATSSGTSSASLARSAGIAGGTSSANTGRTPMSETSRAQFYARAGQFDRALDALERAYQNREGALAWVNVEPSFQPLRSDARFQQIAARVGHHE